MIKKTPRLAIEWKRYQVDCPVPLFAFTRSAI
jgi:hypothetical protein